LNIKETGFEKMITQKDKNTATNKLRSDRIYNLSILGYIQENDLNRLLTIGNSIMAQGSGGEKWIYLCSKDADELFKLIEKLDADDKYFGAIDDWQIPVLTKKREIDWLINAYQYHLPDEEELPENKMEIHKLTAEDSQYIVTQSIYKDMLTIEYINERIERSVSAGIYEEGKLVAWALTHDDSSLGSMHVLNDYRGKGYAREITISLVKQCRAIGKIPFLQCEDKNVAAQRLVESLGFVKDRNVSWLKLN
jgi:8-oxo-dGTP diphosphatase